MKPLAEERPLVEGEDFYREGSAIVFTAGFHLRRGSCCKSGCRHCPYTEVEDLPPQRREVTTDATRETNV